MSARATLLAEFVAAALAQLGETAHGDWRAITGDASFRHFHRVPTARGSVVAVDAPPATENNGQYLRIAERWHRAGLPVPRIFASDLTEGFFLVEDFGDVLFAQALDTEDTDADALYRTALQLTQRIQALPDDGTSPPYERDRFVMELGIFSEWFLGAALRHEMTASEQALLRATEATLIDAVMQQPRTVVHRDWHSRNLLVLPDGTLGIIDFQDALIGPYVYDVVSLLRDCYRRLDDRQVARLLTAYVDGASPQVRTRAAHGALQRDFDLTGMQRHLKAIGIFARLWQRNGRTGYLPDIPRVLDYVATVGNQHPELRVFAEWIATTIVPAWQRRDPLSAANR